MDEITRAEREAAATYVPEMDVLMCADENSESETPQFKLDIRKEPISEEDSATKSAAFSNVANTLRAVGLPHTVSNTVPLT